MKGQHQQESGGDLAGTEDIFNRRKMATNSNRQMPNKTKCRKMADLAEVPQQ